MTDSTATLLAIIFGLAVFAVIVVIGWRSVQHRRIVRLRGAEGQETIVVADEDDEISSVVTTSETTPSAPAASVAGVNTGDAGPATAAGFGRGAAKGETAI